MEDAKQACCEALQEEEEQEQEQEEEEEEEEVEQERCEDPFRGGGGVRRFHGTFRRGWGGSLKSWQNKCASPSVRRPVWLAGWSIRRGDRTPQGPLGTWTA